MPYTVDSGYEFKVLRYWASTDQPIRGDFFLDTYLFGPAYYKDMGVYYEQEIEEFSTKAVDPDFSDSHAINLKGENVGTDSAGGQIVLTALLIEHGSPDIDSKTIKCSNCGNEKEVSLNTTRWECPECGALNLYYGRREG